jgi:hypothetical protein
MKKLLFFIALMGCLTGKSQQFSIKKIELSADKIFVYYDLLDTISNHSYTIRVVLKTMFFKTDFNF